MYCYVNLPILYYIINYVSIKNREMMHYLCIQLITQVGQNMEALKFVPRAKKVRKQKGFLVSIMLGPML
jgi:hypothetical protein